jgi:hypothetical protein
MTVNPLLINNNYEINKIKLLHWLEKYHGCKEPELNLHLCYTDTVMHRLGLRPIAGELGLKITVAREIKNPTSDENELMIMQKEQTEVFHISQLEKVPEKEIKKDPGEVFIDGQIGRSKSHRTIFKELSK